MWDRKSKPLRDLIEIIHFTENVAAKIHGVLEEAEIFRIVREAFVRSGKYNMSILLLTDGGLKLRIAETSLAPGQRKAGEKLVGQRLKDYRIELNKSNVYRQVVKEGRTLQVTVGETLEGLFPWQLAYLVGKVLGLEKRPCILTPLKRNGKVVGVFGMSSTDLVECFVPSVKSLAQHISTALELADECHKHRQAAEELSRLVESQKEFIAHVGHELRTPLSVIKAIVESEIEINSDVPLVQQLDLVNQKVDQTTQMLKNLTLVSRLDIGQEKLQKTRFKLKDLIEEVLADVVKEVSREDISPDVKISCPETVEMTGDRTKLFEVLTNLLQNAVAYANSQPSIFLKVEKRKGRVRITLEDNNPSIPEEDFEKIFEKFYRGKDARGKSGSGLGLYISRRLVELMDGKIWAERGGRVGNRFIVELPADVPLPL